MLSGEGWFDGYALLTAFRARARAQGAHYLRGEVTGMDFRRRAHRVCSTRLWHPDFSRFVVNAAGPWARSVARLAGFDLPVAARRRTVYVIGCRAKLDPFPLLIDPSGFWIRPEGASYIAGMPPGTDPDDAPLEPDYEAFESVLWPALAERIPAFEAARLERAWAGYYEMNLFDHNGIVGFHPQIDNFLLLNGFSGHGIQQAPVVSRGIAELICHGRFVTLDLSELSYNRIIENRPLVGVECYEPRRAAGSSGNTLTSIHDNGLSADVGCSIRQQEQCNLRHFLRLREPPERNAYRQDATPCHPHFP